jgi:hypothetical protein
LGGSGGHSVYAFIRRGQDIGSMVMRITPNMLKNRRGEAEKGNDHILLADLYQEEPEIFQKGMPTDLALIEINKLFNKRMDAMKQRIACEQRLRERSRDAYFLRDDGQYPDICLEDKYASEKANDVILRTLTKVEDECDAELSKAVSAHDSYKEIFKLIEGVGPRIAATLIAYVGDIRRFSNPAKFKMYCGAAPDKKGNFLRKKRGASNSWREEIRQSLFLFADQMNRSPNSEWGQAFRAKKARLRTKYPDVVEILQTDAKGRERMVPNYTNMHIHRKARWHTLGNFCEWLYKEWSELAKKQASIAGDGQQADSEAA